jgi:hypothetical protein
MDGIRLCLGYRGHQVRRYVTALTGTGLELVDVEPGLADIPTLTIQLEVAHALLDALSEHFGGTGGQREQRADYTHERGRVDKLLTALTTIATREQPPNRASP